jgi:tripartite-type tricarboxylate transporter receptor subunit TctC
MAVGHLLSALPPLRGDSVFCPKLHRKRDVPKSPIIATGSTGAIGGHYGFTVHILSVQAQIARGRGEGNMKLAHRRQFLHLAAGAAALPVASRFALAQAYPARPVRILVGFAAGGNFDIVARLIGQWLSDQLHQPVIVENRPGASSNLATEAVIRAPADGYTLLLGGAVNAVNATLYEKLSFNFISDVAPVAGVSRFPNVMTVGASFPAKTVPEFIAYAKANPGKISQGSSGNGTTQHLAGALFKMMTGVNFVHVPYRGASQALTDLLSGQVQVLFEPLPPSMQHIKSGTLRALAVTTATRSEALPDVPTVSEFVPGYEASGWSGVCAPKNTPTDIINRLNKEINAGLADPKTKARLADLGATTLAGSSADFGKLIADETEKWGKAIRTANIKAD